MNKFMAQINKLLAVAREKENQHESIESSTHTAAIPGQTEPKELHHGKRRLKENYTSHWDMDYLSRKEVEEIMGKSEQKRKT